jgi:N-acetylglutamate synthase
VSAPAVEPAPLDLIERLDRHAVAAWPPSTVEETGDGWMLRSSGGIGGRRLNAALTPSRSLRSEEIAAGLDRPAAFAAAHGMPHRVQVSPLHVHDELLSTLTGRGWSFGPEVVVMSGSRSTIVGGAQAGPEDEFVITPEADDAWLAARAHCNPDDDVEAMRRTVLPLIGEGGRFCRIGDRAVGVAVAADGLVALFAVAVSPDARRQGLGKRLVRLMLNGVEADTAYLQVDAGNAGAIALYSGLGFSETFRYLHSVAPTPASA